MAEYDLTVLSILRDSTPYLDRYAAQLRAAARRFEHVHAIWVEGDSRDDTQARLRALVDELPIDVTLVECKTGGPYWPSIDHPQRWRQLEVVWNTALAYLEPTTYAVCVESDLIWDVDTLLACIEQLGEGDAVAPLLLKGDIFYDTHGFSRHSQPFSNRAPYIPDWDGQPRLVACDSLGRLVVTTYPVLCPAP